MENLIKFILEALEKSRKCSVSINDGGTISISYIQKNEVLEEIKKELNLIDTDIFIATATQFKNEMPEFYETMNTIEDEDPDVEAIEEAYEAYKQYVVNYVESKVAEINDEIQDLEEEKERLINKYLGE